MAEAKTQLTNASADNFIAAIGSDQIRRDCERIDEIMREATGEEPRMWGDSLVGYGNYQTRYTSGREVEWMLTAFSPRKAQITLYIMPGFAEYEELLARLGKHSRGKSCLYIKRLSDVDEEVLTELVRASVEDMRSKHVSV